MRLVLQILTLFQTKKCHFPHPFSDLTYPHPFSDLTFRQKLSQNYRAHCRDLKLVSSFARVRNSGSLFKSNVYNLFLPGNLAAVRIIGVSARRELTLPIWLI